MTCSERPEEPKFDWFVFGSGLLLVAFTIAMSGCSPKAVQQIQKEFVYVERVDTTIQRDSIYLKEVVRGDTVRITEYRDKFVYRYQLKRDTVAIHDTFRVEREKIVQVEKSMSAFQSFKQRSWGGLCTAFLLALVWIFRKPLLAAIKILFKL